MTNLDAQLERIEGKVDALLWMTGALLLLNIAIAAGALRPLVRIAAKVGALG